MKRPWLVQCGACHACGPVQRGFALVIVLWVLAGLTVVAVAVASSTRASSESVKLLRERVRGEAQFLSTAARLQVLLATGVQGRGHIEGDRGRAYADGRSTRVAVDEWVSLQDTRGLINLNARAPERLSRLLAVCGASEQEVASLLDNLADYIDSDNLKRLNGAEAFDYRSANLPEPRNAKLMSRNEVWRVKGWAGPKSAWVAAGCDDLVTVHNDERFNPNTAPSTLLQVNGMTQEAASALVEARRDGLPSLTIQRSGADANDPFGFLGGGFVGSTLRISHQAASVEWRLVYELELTPLREGGPWRLHDIRYPPRFPGTPTTQAELPAPDFQLPERDRAPRNASSGLPFAN
jgi:Type II secretion system (T2SS), protein K